MRFNAFMASLAALCWTALCGQIDNSATRPYVDAKVAEAVGAIPTSRVAYATSAGEAGTASNATTATQLRLAFTYAWLYDDPGMLGDRTNELRIGSGSLEAPTYTSPHLKLDGYSGRVGWSSGDMDGSIWHTWLDFNDSSATMNFDSGSWAYIFGSGGNVVTSNQSEVNFGITRASNIVQTAGGWDDFVFPANALGIFAAADVTLLPVSNAIVFATTCTTNLSNGDHVWATMQMPHGWVTNTMISPHVHFVQEHADQTNMWFLRYKWYNIGDAIPTTWIELDTSTNKVAYSSGPTHQVAEFDDIDGTHGMSSILDIKLYRKGTTGTGAAMMKQFDVHYRRNSFGSDTEYTKSF